MAIESIINYIRAEKKPGEMLVYGFVVATLSIFLSLWVFPSYASFAMVTFTVMAVLPLMVSIIAFEQDNQDLNKGLKRILTHKKAVHLFVFLFLGFLFAYMLWFLLLPVDVSNNLFFLQINTITEINSPTGSATLPGGAFSRIFFNNIRILALSIIFSFIFGSGAIFILAWNASVLGVAMATTMKITLAASGSGSSAYFGAFSFALLRFLVHGIPEITSYFLGGLAGGIIAFSLLDYKLGAKKLIKNLSSSFKNGSLLIIVSILLLVIAALIEIYLGAFLIQ